MKAYWQLTLAQLKLFVRNRSIIFWTTLFPLFLMIVLGLFLGGGTMQSISLGWVDEDQSTYSQELRTSFELAESVSVQEWEATDEAVAEIEEGSLSFVLVVPEGFGEQMAAGGQVPPFEVYYDEVDQAVAELGFALIEQEIDQLNKQLVNFEETLTVQRQGIQSAELTYLDFLVPGIAALMILSSNMNGVASQIASWRERGVLRRMQSTGLSAGTFIAAQITARFSLNGTQALLVLLVGIYVLGAQMNGSWLLLFFYMALGTLVFMAIGFIIASLAKTPEHAGPVAGFLSFPMIFLGGIFFPIANMPSFLQPVVYALPISHLSDTMRHVMNLGHGVGELWVSSLILIVWFLASFLFAARLFRWE